MHASLTRLRYPVSPGDNTHLAHTSADLTDVTLVPTLNNIEKHVVDRFISDRKILHDFQATDHGATKPRAPTEVCTDTEEGKGGTEYVQSVKDIVQKRAKGTLNSMYVLQGQQEKKKDRFETDGKDDGLADMSDNA